MFIVIENFKEYDYLWKEIFLEKFFKGILVKEVYILILFLYKGWRICLRGRG